MTYVEIAPEILRWAIERSGKSPETLVRRFSKLNAWIEGAIAPTFKQLEDFASATYTPFGYFFLNTPPAEPLPIPDFRTHNAETLRKPSGNLLDTIYLCQMRQAWFEDFAQEEDIDPNPFISSLSLQTPITVAADRVRGTFSFDIQQRAQDRTWAEALSRMIQNVEDQGVLVMVSGIVGSNTHRKLDPDEFRGFALASPLAPLVFVNGSDSKSAQMFTLAHELAHLGLGATGLSDPEASAFPDQQIERWCNQVAAEVLVPLDLFRQLLRPAESIPDATARLARHFKVSSLVILRRLWEAGVFATRDEFHAAYTRQVQNLTTSAAASAGGGDFYRTLSRRVGQRFEFAVVGSALAGRTSFREALQLLGFSRMSTFDRLARQLGYNS